VERTCRSIQTGVRWRWFDDHSLVIGIGEKYESGRDVQATNTARILGED
jgi:hypothetical protein